MQMNAYSKDIRGHYLSANPEFIAFTQLNHVDELLGKTDLDMPWCSNAAVLMDHDALVITTGKSHVFIEQAVIGGQSHYRRACKAPLLGPTGKILGIVGISTPVEPSTLVALTPRQTACLKALAEGMSIKKIGKVLGLSPRTVEHYLNTVKEKLHCESRSELVVHAIMRGLVA